ncbi:hypothetical protein BV25DRAFT_1990437 [Artomyces pyxidatus]|uniref:Uncharacterized protein n=1 Tax=Artomyces pyxidatus TaxID=48021 RepID=A0ACB8T5P1_9AGAM|nr:hypothetical protein BV25DRAFT_1990437 [Artomyces pyxidatus]
MHIPFISPARKRLERRKGGGGKGGGGKGGGGDGGGGSSSGGRSVPVSSLPAGKSSATTSGAGGGRPIVIPPGQPFSGRSAGGGTRTQVYGTNVYGSGYPGTANVRGVAGLGLPFYFWPVVWGGAGFGAGSYLHDEGEYGEPDNSTRPGGPMAQAQFQSNSTGSIFHVLSDNSTVASLITSINANCSSDLSLSNSSTVPTAYDATNATDPKPEQAVQYYRSSSVVLTLDGYNDTAALNNDTNAPATPLPSGIDTTLLGCLNDTIGSSVPLVDAGLRWGPPNVLSLSLLSLVVFRLLAF